MLDVFKDVLCALEGLMSLRNIHNSLSTDQTSHYTLYIRRRYLFSVFLYLCLI